MAQQHLLPLHFRYGAPGDDNIYLSWPNDASAGDASLKEYRIVSNTGAIISTDTTGDGTPDDYTLDAQTNLAFDGSGPQLLVSDFS